MGTNVELPDIDFSRLTLEDVGPTFTLEEMEARARRLPARLRRLVMTPWWALQGHRSRRRSVRQRRDRGWTDGELWNLDVHLCAHLGSMLASQVDEVRNHPPELEYDEWQAQIRAAGLALLAYDADDADRVSAARSALRWVTHHLVDLWD